MSCFFIACHVTALHGLQDQDEVEEPQLKKQRTGASETGDVRKLLVANEASKSK